MPTYLVKWKAEILWVAALLANSVIIGGILMLLGVSAERIAAVEVILGAVSRLLYGIILPTPTESQAIESVLTNLPPEKLGR